MTSYSKRDVRLRFKLNRLSITSIRCKLTGIAWHKPIVTPDFYRIVILFGIHRYWHITWRRAKK